MHTPTQGDFLFFFVFFPFNGEGMLVYSGEAQLVAAPVMADTEVVIVTFLICVQSKEPHDLISSTRSTTRSLQWKCSGICIFFLCGRSNK